MHHVHSEYGDSGELCGVSPTGKFSVSDTCLDWDSGSSISTLEALHLTPTESLEYWPE